MPATEQDLLKRVLERLDEPPRYAADAERSILEEAAAAYSAGLADELEEEHTRPTGFNPNAAALFEAVIESAFLVANADGEFDEREVATFKTLVVTACHGKVTEGQVEALLADFSDQLEEDGMDKRVEMVARVVRRPEQAAEVLRISALLALSSAGVSAKERAILERMAGHFGVSPEGLAEVLAEVDSALAS